MLHEKLQTGWKENLKNLIEHALLLGTSESSTLGATFDRSDPKIQIENLYPQNHKNCYKQSKQTLNFVSKD